MKLFEKLNQKEVKRGVLQGLSLARVLHFTAQSALLPVVDQIVNGRNKQSFVDLKNHLEQALPKVQTVIEQDVDAMIEGYYPERLLFNEKPTVHFLRIPRLFTDAYRAAHQRKNKEAHTFQEESSEYLSEMPEYYRRNFHFQKDGYLSESSAHLYEHQVEVLFAGSAQAMRRRVLIPMKKHFQFSSGEGLKILEIGCGTGALTRNIALAFPKAQMTAIDLSPHYLACAQNSNPQLMRVNWVQGQGESLDYRDETFDAVLSCYLFHELPEAVRFEIMKEKLRVLKPGGFVAVADSLQKDDDESLNWALERFPADFHEPFYKNYTLKKLEAIFAEVGVTNISTELAFLTKVVSGVK
jgi:ubiquinone/menaquinone biosynthesis C-methylase UbiE